MEKLVSCYWIDIYEYKGLDLQFIFDSQNDLLAVTKGKVNIPDLYEFIISKWFILDDLFTIIVEENEYFLNDLSEYILDNNL